MTEQQRSLSLFYKGWDRYQWSLVTAVAPLSSEQLRFRLAHHWPIGRIAAHVIAARVWWLCSRAGEEGSADLVPMEHWDTTGEPLHEARELVRGLELTWEVIANVLERWTPADLSLVLEARPDDPNERTKQWIIWHLIEHDISHGSEISGVLGAHGLPTIASE